MLYLLHVGLLTDHFLLGRRQWLHGDGRPNGGRLAARYLQTVAKRCTSASFLDLSLQRLHFLLIAKGVRVQTASENQTWSLSSLGRKPEGTFHCAPSLRNR